ncbi:methyltransferase domain-containing protein [Pycnococcus provasolii]
MQYRSFDYARAYVHTLGLKSKKEWHAWSASGARPYDIPGRPDEKYASSGWTSYGDFLGYKIAKVARVGPRMHYRSFEDARAYVRSLRMKSVEEWAEWKSLGTRPHDIPSNPYHEYASSGWVSYGDFLGYAVGKAAGEYRAFEEARTYVHRLGLKSKEEWQVWSASGVRPYDIPSAPDEKYASSGWTSYGDFLGYDIDQVDGNLRSFEDARAYVRALGLPSQKEWKTWRMSGVRPSDIPRSPEVTYKSLGWTSYGDFLGYDIDHKAQVRPRMQFRGAVDQKAHREYRSFDDARAYVHTLGLTSSTEWRAWSSSGARPHDIPSNPDRTYKSAGWVSYRDFLGYEERVGRSRMHFRSFDDARAYVHTLGLTSQKEWTAWSASGARPRDIPGDPDKYYASAGWTSYPDFLGYDAGKAAEKFRSFEDARAYVHTLGLKSAKVWKVWSASGARPRDIPSTPDQTYASTGWVSYGDFLGYEERVGRPRMQCRSFDDARAYVRTLGLKSQNEWSAWCASGARPHDIPRNPDRTYKSAGWLSYPDFLGYDAGKAASEFRSFDDARAYVHTLGLKSATEWRAWSSSGARPHDIPGDPHQTYKSAGWTSYGDFLGYQIGKVAGEYRSFDEARAYVHTLGLKSQKEWRAWRASGARPHDIPSTPDYTYKSAGWLSYPDFLGYNIGKVAEKFRSFEDARGYVHTLGLTSQKEWTAWSASGARPRDIPSTPDRTYKSSGWTSYGDFLGYTVGRV